MRFAHRCSSNLAMRGRGKARQVRDLRGLGRGAGWLGAVGTSGSTTARSQMDSSLQPGADVTATAVAPFACAVTAFPVKRGIGRRVGVPWSHIYVARRHYRE